jgi:hypothetical protein
LYKVKENELIILAALKGRIIVLQFITIVPCKSSSRHPPHPSSIYGRRCTYNKDLQAKKPVTAGGEDVNNLRAVIEEVKLS